MLLELTVKNSFSTLFYKKIQKRALICIGLVPTHFLSVLFLVQSTKQRMFSHFNTAAVGEPCKC